MFNNEKTFELKFEDSYQKIDFYNKAQVTFHTLIFMQFSQLSIFFVNKKKSF